MDVEEVPFAAEQHELAGLVRGHQHRGVQLPQERGEARTVGGPYGTRVHRVRGGMVDHRGGGHGESPGEDRSSAIQCVDNAPARRPIARVPSGRCAGSAAVVAALPHRPPLPTWEPSCSHRGVMSDSGGQDRVAATLSSEKGVRGLSRFSIFFRGPTGSGAV